MNQVQIAQGQDNRMNLPYTPIQQRFINALEALDAAQPFVKPRYQTEVFRTAGDLIDSDGGLDFLFQQAHRFDSAGVFHTGPWQDPSKLLPELVGTGLKGEAQYPIIETLSELRILAIAKGSATSESLDEKKAHLFIKKVVCLNLDLLYFTETEQTRKRKKVYQRAVKVIQYLTQYLSPHELIDELTSEISEIVAQRPILNAHVLKLIRYASKLISKEKKEYSKLSIYIQATNGPSPLSKVTPSLQAYRKKLPTLTSEELNAEMLAFNKVLEATGFGNPYHAILLRYLRKNDPEKIKDCLNLDGRGQAEFDKFKKTVLTILQTSILPNIPGGIYGLSGVLNRGLLSQNEVNKGIIKLIEMDVSHAAKQRLLIDGKANLSGLTPNSILISGVLEVLGHPLSVGQGPNPTCQSARAISLWSQHSPGYLLTLLNTALRDDLVEMDFEGQTLRSSEIQVGVTGINFDYTKLDAVSRLLVPHLDKIYNEMMRRASLRAEDPHKWVNPAFYGRLVHKGFASVFDALSGHIVQYESFLRRFYATHHPDYNDDMKMVYPNPVGLFVTDVNGNLLGPHAVTLLRIAKPKNSQEYRAYFYNPNNEGRQEWGGGLSCKVSGNGEKAGETSLTFSEFLSRLYAFHFNQYEEGDAYAVPQELLDRITSMAKESWGKAYVWGV